MKKLLTMLALTLMTVIMTVTVVGCGADSSAVDNLTDKVEELTERIEDLESKNNVFWTDKKEYSENDTMTVYFGQKAVFNIKIDFSNSYGTGFFGQAFNNSLMVTSLSSDIYADSIVATSFLVWENGTCIRTTQASTTVVKQNVEKEISNQYDATESIAANAQWYDLVICVPGTPFELARFKNVSFRIR